MPKATRDGDATRFEGFADSKLAFFRALAKNQDRAWYAAHKSEHEEGWVRPMKALLAEVRDRIDKAYPDCELADPKVFRIQRDVRFSPDKSPYKTSIAGAILARGGRAIMEAPAALYVHLELSRKLVGGGFYMMPKDALDRFRAAVDDDGTGKEVMRIVSRLRKKGYGIGAAETLKTIPRGFDADHPRAELLRQKGLVASVDELPAKLLVSRDLVPRVVAAAKDVAPLVRWLVFNAS